jgi:hypothetical protein
MECAFILLSRSLVIFGADPPIHAPATIAGAALAEKGFKGGPQRGRKRSNRERHLASFFHAYICNSSAAWLTATDHL